MTETISTRRQRSHPFAQQLVQKALRQGFTMPKIAEVCNVGLTSVYRWIRTGKGDRTAVHRLEVILGPIEVSAKDVSLMLVSRCLAEDVPFNFSDVELFKVCGPPVDSPGFIEELTALLFQRGFFLLKFRTKGQLFYHILSQSTVKAASKREIKFPKALHVVSSEEVDDGEEDQTVHHNLPVGESEG